MRAYMVLSQQKLMKLAVNYLGRYMVTEYKFVEYLDRKINQSLATNPDQDKDLIMQWRGEVLNKVKTYNYISDENYTESKMASLIRVGRPQRYIVTYLKNKGVSQDTIINIWEKLTQELDYNVDDLAALRYLKKRGFGVYSRKALTDELIKKQLMSMMRAGYSYEQSFFTEC